ncbi:MAG: tricarboxylate transporter, partial [Deltaproteobacteria bacterium]|nr:tricarboxylate transporter [Deltaproteobacteria bacterium]
ALVAIGLLGVGMKRFGWSRPAMLIGFVLADQIETYLYQAIQFHEWGMATRPGVLIIAAIIVVSIWLGARNRPEGEPGTDAPQRHARNLTPQLLFAGFAVAVFVIALADSLRHTLLGAVFPASAAAVMLVAGLFVLHGIWRSAGEPTSYNEDAERPGIEGHETPEKGIWYYLNWLLALLGMTALAGFFISLNLFFLAFLRREAKESWSRTVLLTVMADLVLMFLSWLMTLDLPEGLLQHNVPDLPWPLGPI